MSQPCQNKLDNFCYICGELTLIAQTKPLSPLVRKAYKIYFSCKVDNQYTVWAPKICSSSCLGTLIGWLKDMHKSIPFAILMVWHEPGILLDCYFCITNTTGFSGKSKHRIEYPNIDSSKVSLKAVLLYNGNTHPSIPSAHAVHKK